MANRFPEFDEFHLDILNQLSKEVDMGTDLAIRRSEKIEFEGQVSAIRSHPANAMNTKPVAVVRDKVKRRRRAPKVPWRKPFGMPKRPLSAYNLFFQSERERLIENRSEKTDEEGSRAKTCGIGFANLAKNVASKWKNLDAETKAVFQARAMKEKVRYKKEIEIWKATEKKVKNQMKDEKFEKSKDLVSPMKVSSDAVRRTSDPFLVAEPLHVSSLEEPLMQRRVTFSCRSGMDVDNIGGFDTLFENDYFQKIKPTSILVRSHSDSFIELRSNANKTFSFEAPETDKSRLLLQSEGNVSNNFRLMKQLLTELNEDDVQFITALNYPE